MAVKEILKKLIAEGWEFKPDYVKRGRVPKELALKNPSIVITGPRRAGKSFAAHEVSELFLEEGGAKRGLRINFEDDRLAGFTRQDFDFILEAYREMRDEKPAVFFDEIQNVEGWDTYIRRLADSGYKVVVTGSNSSMLSREIAEKLGGRFAETTILPLSFIEFLSFKGVRPSRESLYSGERFRIKKYFDEYLQWGGFPEIAMLEGAESKKKMLESYFDLVFYKDLLSRRKLENEPALRFIIKKLRECIGKPVTPSSVYSSMKASGIEAGPNTVERYIGYLEGAYLLLPCLPFAKSVRKQERKKRYFADNGYIKIFEVKDDATLLLENLVFMELAKGGRSIGYHAGKRECDFVVDGKSAIQVAYSLSDSSREREIEGLLEAMEAYRLKEGVIITYDQETEISVGKRRIRVVPAWKWCLESLRT